MVDRIFPFEPGSLDADDAEDRQLHMLLGLRLLLVNGSWLKSRN